MIAARVVLAVAALESPVPVLRTRVERVPSFLWLKRREHAGANGLLGRRGEPSQMIAFFGGAVATIGFFVWVAYLVKK